MSRDILEIIFQVFFLVTCAGCFLFFILLLLLFFFYTLIVYFLFITDDVINNAVNLVTIPDSNTCLSVITFTITFAYVFVPGLNLLIFLRLL